MNSTVSTMLIAVDMRIRAERVNALADQRALQRVASRTAQERRRHAEMGMDILRPLASAMNGIADILGGRFSADELHAGLTTPLARRNVS